MIENTHKTNRAVSLIVSLMRTDLNPQLNPRMELIMICFFIAVALVVRFVKDPWFSRERACQDLDRMNWLAC